MRRKCKASDLDVCCWNKQVLSKIDFFIFTGTSQGFLDT